LVGLIVAAKNKTVGRYMLIWITASLLSSIILLGLILLPNLVNNIMNFLF
jgi:hypothetical protein